MFATWTTLLHLVLPLLSQPDTNNYSEWLKYLSEEGKDQVELYRRLFKSVQNVPQPGTNSPQICLKGLLEEGKELPEVYRWILNNLQRANSQQLCPEGDANNAVHQDGADVGSANSSSSHMLRAVDKFTYHSPDASVHLPSNISQIANTNSSANDTMKPITSLQQVTELVQAPAVIVATATSQTKKSEADHELKQFVEHFKQRRLELGLTLANVEKALAQLKIPGARALSKATLSAFENFALSMRNMFSLRPLLQAWLEEVKGEQPSSGTRRITSASQKSLLMEHFRKEPKPNREKILVIASQLGTDVKFVQGWFTNRRHKQNRYHLMEASNLPSSSQQFGHFKTSPTSDVNSCANGTADPTASTSEELGNSLQEARQFVEYFKQKRLELRVSQADVAKAVVQMEIPGARSLNRQMISRFENFELSRKRMGTLKPILQAWLEKAEESAKVNDSAQPSETGGQLRTIFTARQKYVLQGHFRDSAYPGGEQISTIADQLGLSKKVVQQWFNNQRRNKKRMVATSFKAATVAPATASAPMFPAVAVKSTRTTYFNVCYPNTSEAEKLALGNLRRCLSQTTQTEEDLSEVEILQLAKDCIVALNKTLFDNVQLSSQKQANSLSDAMGQIAANQSQGSYNNAPLAYCANLTDPKQHIPTTDVP